MRYTNKPIEVLDDTTISNEVPARLKQLRHDFRQFQQTCSPGSLNLVWLGHSLNRPTAKANLALREFARTASR